MTEQEGIGKGSFSSQQKCHCHIGRDRKVNSIHEENLLLFHLVIKFSFLSNYAHQTKNFFFGFSSPLHSKPVHGWKELHGRKPVLFPHYSVSNWAVHWRFLRWPQVECLLVGILETLPQESSRSSSIAGPLRGCKSRSCCGGERVKLSGGRKIKSGSSRNRII